MLMSPTKYFGARPVLALSDATAASHDLLAAAVDDDVRAFLEQHFRRGVADARRAAGDERRLALQLQVEREARLREPEQRYRNEQRPKQHPTIHLSNSVIF